MPHAEIAIASAPVLDRRAVWPEWLPGGFWFPGATDSALPADAQATPGALKILRSLKERGVPCAWLDELPPAVTTPLAADLATLAQGSLALYHPLARPPRLLASPDGTEYRTPWKAASWSAASRACCNRD